MQECLYCNKTSDELYSPQAARGLAEHLSILACSLAASMLSYLYHVIER